MENNMPSSFSGGFGFNNNNFNNNNPFRKGSNIAPDSQEQEQEQGFVADNDLYANVEEMDFVEPESPVFEVSPTNNATINTETEQTQTKVNIQLKRGNKSFSDVGDVSINKDVFQKKKKKERSKQAKQTFIAVLAFGAIVIIAGLFFLITYTPNVELAKEAFTALTYSNVSYEGDITYKQEEFKGSQATDNQYINYLVALLQGESKTNAETYFGAAETSWLFEVKHSHLTFTDEISVHYITPVKDNSLLFTFSVDRKQQFAYVSIEDLISIVTQYEWNDNLSYYNIDPTRIRANLIPSVIRIMERIGYGNATHIKVDLTNKSGLSDVILETLNTIDFASTTNPYFNEKSDFSIYTKTDNRFMYSGEIADSDITKDIYDTFVDTSIIAAGSNGNKVLTEISKLKPTKLMFESEVSNKQLSVQNTKLSFDNADNMLEYTFKAKMLNAPITLNITQTIDQTIFANKYYKIFEPFEK
jgi:hypothetical protein